MGVCNFRVLNKLTLNAARDAIKRYSSLNGPWLHQFDTFFRTIRATAAPDERMIKLLTVVRGAGWNMNRQGQCAHIIEAIETGRISKEELNHFWATVDALPNVDLRNLPSVDRILLKQIVTSFQNIRTILHAWHSSSDSLCFTTKVILMFNWGQSPAFDTRIRSVMKLRNDMSNEDLVTALVEIGTWIQDFESLHHILLDKLATDEMRLASRDSLSPLPLGRSFDMMLFSLTANA